MNRRHALVLTALAAVLLLPFIGGGFYTDDFAHVARLRASGGHGLFTHPDVFGFYRPLTQASLYIDWVLYGEWAPGYRITSLVLHLLVILCALEAATGILRSHSAAAFATLAFVLTPKAHPIAVLWASARGDLLAALFSFLSVSLWMRWTRGSRAALWGALAAYVLAFLSKETAAALPAFLLLLPRDGRQFGAKLLAVLAFAACGALIVLARNDVGALMPWAGKGQYRWLSSAGWWMHNAGNYLRRGALSPVAMLVLVALPAWRVNRAHLRWKDVLTVGFVGVAFFLIVIAPVLGMPARSELYLYLPVFGLCLVAGYVSAPVTAPRRYRALTGAFVVLLSTFVIQKAYAIHRDLVVSEAFVDALRKDEPAFAGVQDIGFVPANETIERQLRGALGYIDLATRFALRRNDVWAVLVTPETPGTPRATRVLVDVDGSEVVLRSVPSRTR